MRTLVRAMLATALALAPSAALAGPISWGYTATFRGDENPDLLYLGPHARPDSWEPNGIRYGSIYATPAAVSPDGTHPGGARVRVGQLSNSGVGVIWADDVQPAGGFSDAYTGCLTISDASGAAGSFLISGTGCIVSDPMLYDFRLDLALSGSSVQERVIGSTRYRVQFATEADASGVWLAADVSPVTAAPEPGTLALAGLGALSLGLVRRVRVT